MRLRVRLALLFAMALCHAQAGGLSFPFQLREGLIWVQVDTPTSPTTLNFLLDTGAGVSVLNLGAARRLGLNSGRQVTVQGIGANSIGYWPEELAARAGEVSLPSKFLAVDLSALSGACKCRVDGLIGADFFAGHAVEIDFRTHQINLVASVPPCPGQAVVPLKRRHGALLVPAQVNESSRQWFRLDTGCASSLQWVTAQQQVSPVHRHLAVALAPISVGSANTTLHLGEFTFPNTPTGVHDKPLFQGEAGLIGNGLLSQFSSLIIEIPANRLVLQR